MAALDLPFRMKSLDTVLGVPDGPESGEIKALSVSTGQVEWDTKVTGLPLGAASAAGNLDFTTLFNCALLAPNRATGAIVYRRQLPAPTNAPIAIAGDRVLVPLGAPATSKTKPRGKPQLVAYTVP